MQTILALDIGTTGTKAALIDRSGRLLVSGYAEYPTYPGDGNIVEQEPDDWWRATCRAIQEIRPHLSASPAAIVLSGQMQDCTLLGCDGALGRALLYSDSRARAEAAFLAENIGYDELTRITGNEQGASSLLAKWLWLQRHDPERLAKTNALLFGAHDYVAWQLGALPGTDATTAATTGLLDLEKNDWAYDLIARLGLDRWLLPKLQAAQSVAGTVSESGAAATGLAEGIPILRGCGDLGATTLGVGAGEPGRVYAYLGTSGWVAATLDEATPNPQGGVFTLRHPDPRRFIQVAPMLTAGGNLDWLRAHAADDPGASISYQRLNELAATVPAGSRGLLYLPYLAGERSPFSDADARACFIGISAQTTQAEMARAVMEGVALAYRSLCAALYANAERRLESIYLVGGGAKSPLWPQIMADVLGCTVQVVAAPGDAAARGAALIAGRALGWWDSYAPADEFFPMSQRFEPSVGQHSVYDDLYAIFCALYPQLRGTFAGLAAVSSSRS